MPFPGAKEIPIVVSETTTRRRQIECANGLFQSMMSIRAPRELSQLALDDTDTVRIVEQHDGPRMTKAALTIFLCDIFGVEHNQPVWQQLLTTPYTALGANIFAGVWRSMDHLKMVQCIYQLGEIVYIQCASPLQESNLFRDLYLSTDWRSTKFRQAAREYIKKLPVDDINLRNARLLQDFFGDVGEMNSCAAEYQLMPASGFETASGFVKTIQTGIEIPPAPIAVHDDGADYDLCIIDFKPSVDGNQNRTLIYARYEGWSWEEPRVFESGDVDQWSDFWDGQKINIARSLIADDEDNEMDDMEMAEHWVNMSLREHPRRSLLLTSIAYAIQSHLPQRYPPENGNGAIRQYTRDFALEAVLRRFSNAKLFNNNTQAVVDRPVGTFENAENWEPRSGDGEFRGLVVQGICARF